MHKNYNQQANNGGKQNVPGDSADQGGAGNETESRETVQKLDSSV